MCSWRYPLLKGDGEPPVHSISGQVKVYTFLYLLAALQNQRKRPKAAGWAYRSHRLLPGDKREWIFPEKLLRRQVFDRLSLGLRRTHVRVRQHICQFRVFGGGFAHQLPAALRVERHVPSGMAIGLRTKEGALGAPAISGLLEGRVGGGVIGARAALDGLATKSLSMLKRLLAVAPLLLKPGHRALRGGRGDVADH